MNDIQVSLIKNLIEETMRAGKLSVHQLASELGVSHQTIYDWRDGRYAPKFQTLGKIRALDEGGWKTKFAIKFSLILLSE